MAASITPAAVKSASATKIFWSYRARAIKQTRDWAQRLLMEYQDHMMGSVSALAASF